MQKGKDGEEVFSLFLDNVSITLKFKFICYDYFREKKNRGRCLMTKYFFLIDLFNDQVFLRKR